MNGDTHSSNPNLPRALGVSVEEVGYRILGFLIDHDGWYEDDPGEVLKAIAEAIACDYFGVAVAVRSLESIGFIAVTRYTSTGPYRGNRITGIAMVEGPTMP